MAKTLEEVIAQKGYVVTKPKGTSMFPLIRDSKYDVYIVKPEPHLNKYDVPVYKRTTGEYVMHRILGEDKDGYICCGDNQWILEYGVKDSQVIGVLKEWYHKDKKKTVEDEKYKRYVKFWCKSLKRRHFILFFCHKYMRVTGTVKEIWKKLYGKNSK